MFCGEKKKNSNKKINFEHVGCENVHIVFVKVKALKTHPRVSDVSVSRTEFNHTAENLSTFGISKHKIEGNEG